MAQNPKLSKVATLVRRHDRDRFACALFAPADKREHLLALYAFNYEVARIRETVSERLLGSIRLQWWRETLAAIARGEPARAHAAAAPLAEAIKAGNLDAAEFERILDAREADLLPDPPVTLQALEDYAAATSGGLAVLALELLGVGDEAAREAARHLGAGYALAGLLRAAAFHARAGRSFLPAALDPRRRVLALKPHADLVHAARAIAAAARSRLQTARGRLPAAARPVTLQAVLAEHWLGRLEKSGYDLFAPRVARPDPWRALRLMAAARCGGY